MPSLLIARPAPVCLADAVNKPAPNMLMSEFWHQGELAVLFGNSGTGKSALAVKMAEAICKGEPVSGFKTETQPQKVVYFDFDTSDRQFADRYSGYRFSDNFIRVTINREHCELKKFGEQLFAAMEEAIKQHDARVIIIDSLSTLKYLVNDLFFLTRLLQLKNRLRLSVLLLAGAKKWQPGRPLALGNMAAHKMVVGMADSVFGLGVSKQEENGRYLIHLKGKELGAVYHQTHVVTGRNAVTPVTGLPGFEFTGYGTERLQLALPLSPDGLEAKILDYRSKAPYASLAEIAKWTGTNKMKVKRVLERYDVKPENLNLKSEKPNAQPGHTKTSVVPSSFSNPGLQPGELARKLKTLENTAVTLVTPEDEMDDLVFEIRYDEPGTKQPSYSQQLRKRLHQASLQRKAGKKK